MARPGTFLLLLLLASNPLAARSLADEVDAYIATEMQARKIPGLALAVIDHGRVAFKRAYGSANLETCTPVRTGSVFELSSVTKPFTATLPAFVHRFAPGHRIRFVVAGGSVNYRGGLEAVRRGRLAFVASPALGRPSPRVVEGIEALCRAVDRLR